MKYHCTEVYTTAEKYTPLYRNVHLQDWMLRPATEWNLSSDFRLFARLVKAVAVDNTIGERGENRDTSIILLLPLLPPPLLLLLLLLLLLRLPRVSPHN